jgi:LPXTG-motif cell wall-anchored protein
VVGKISLAVLLLTISGVASADDDDRGCRSSFWFESCRQPVRAPELDSASAIAGLTMLAGGLAVLQGRRRKITIEK